jgi:uncharacterized protein (DUF1501 family)
MTRLVWVSALLAAAALAASPARADGALAVGSTSDVIRDGIAVGTSVNYKTADEALDAAMQRCRNYKPAPKAAALCQSVGTFKGECYAVSFDPKAGTPGAGWAIAPTKALAEERAMTNCQITAGANRAEFCKIEESNCDEY